MAAVRTSLSSCLRIENCAAMPAGHFHQRFYTASLCHQQQGQVLVSPLIVMWDLPDSQLTISPFLRPWHHWLVRDQKSVARLPVSTHMRSYLRLIGHNDISVDRGRIHGRRESLAGDPGRLFLINQARSANLLCLEGDINLNAVGNFYKGNATIHPVILTIE